MFLFLVFVELIVRCSVNLLNSILFIGNYETALPTQEAVPERPGIADESVRDSQEAAERRAE